MSAGILKQSTAVTLKLGPFLDDTDFKTPETTLSIGQSDIQIDKAGAGYAQTSDAAPSTTHDVDGWYPIPLTTTDTGTVGLLKVQVAMAGALPVWESYQVVEEAIYDAYFAASATGLPTGIATSANQTTIANSVTTVANRLGSWTATGVNTVLGAFQFLMRSDATAVSDIGGTYDDATDSLQAIRDHIGNGVNLTEAGGDGDHLSAIPIVPANVTQIGGVAQSATDLKDFADEGYDPATNKVQGVVLVDTTTTNTDMLTAAAVNAEVDTALADIHLDHFIASADPGAVVANNSFLAKLVSKSATAAFTDYVNTTDSLQAIRDNTAWDTATGFSTHKAADVRTEVDANSTQLAAIVADTNELQTDWADAGRLDTILDATATASALATVDTVVDAIKVVTDALPDAGALTTIDANVDAVKVVTDALTSAAATKLAASMSGLVNTSVNDASATTTSFVTALTEATNDHYNQGVIVFTSGVLIGQRTDITDYDGTSKTVTVTALTEAPGNGDTFVII